MSHALDLVSLMAVEAMETDSDGFVGVALRAEGATPFWIIWDPDRDQHA